MSSELKLAEHARLLVEAQAYLAIANMQTHHRDGWNQAWDNEIFRCLAAAQQIEEELTRPAPQPVDDVCEWKHKSGHFWVRSCDGRLWASHLTHIDCPGCGKPVREA